MKRKIKISWALDINPMDEGQMALLAFFLMLVVFMGPVVISGLAGEHPWHSQRTSWVAPGDYPSMSHFEP